MKNSITPTILVSMFFSILAVAQQPPQILSPWYERKEMVILEDKKVPDGYKRNNVTDTKGRSIEGEWLIIDRKSKLIKIRRTTDKKEFEIPFANLCKSDLKYAELETGSTPMTGDEPPVPIDLIMDQKNYRYVRTPTNVFMHGGKITKVENINDDTIRVTRVTEPKFSNEPISVTDLPINMLTERDRGIIKEHTGIDVPALPRPEWTIDNAKYWHARGATGFILDGKKTPDPSSILSLNIMIMSQHFNQDEIIDHIWTKTISSSFIFKLSSKEFESLGIHKKSFKPIELYSNMLEPADKDEESVSLMQNIKRLKIWPYEEKTPRDPMDVEYVEDPKKPGSKTISQPGVPIDGQLQALHFICQYMGMSEGKKKVELSTLLENTTSIGTGGNDPKRRSRFFHEEQVYEGIEKTYGRKSWKPHVGSMKTPLEFRLVKHHLRRNIPVYANVKKTELEMQDGPNKLPLWHEKQIVITGFTAKKGQETKYDGIVIEGLFITTDIEPYEYKVYDVTNIPESEIILFRTKFFE